MVVTEDDVKTAVNNLLEKDKEEILKQRYLINVGAYLAKLRGMLPFAEGGMVKKTLDDVILSLLGPVTDEDKKRKDEAKKSDAGTSIRPIPTSTANSV